MTKTSTRPEDMGPEIPLVNKLRELQNKGDRGALAALRTGLGKPPGTAARMFPIVAPFLSSDYGPRTQAAFLTAALFAAHPMQEAIGSLGASLRRAVSQKHNEEGVERRFAAALDTDPEDLPRHLEGLVSLCESAGAPIDWNRFYVDVERLLSDWTRKNDPKRLIRDDVKMRWAREFWRSSAKNDTSPEGEEETE